MTPKASDLPLPVRFLLMPAAWCLARMPQVGRFAIAWVLGGFLYHAFPKRRRILLANLYHAFPNWPEKKRRRIGRRSCSGVIEMGLIGICAPFLPLSWLRKHFRHSPRMRAFFASQLENPRSALFLVPHFALFESMIWSCRGLKVPEMGVLFRPPNQQGFADFLAWSRAKTGITMLSKKEGLARAMGFLREKGNLAILFDQNAGPPGAGILFLDQLCSATDLAGTFARKFQTEIFIFFIRRIKGWEMEMDLVPLETAHTPRDVTLSSNDWLSHTLRETQDEQFVADWMWIHNRWKFQWDVHQCLGVDFKKSYLPDILPRRKRFWIALPETIEDEEALLTFLTRFRKSRPDAHVTLLIPHAEIPADHTCLRSFSEEQVTLPPTPDRAFFRAFRTDYPDTFLTLSDDPETERRARWINIPVRIGWEFPDKPRRHLTARYPIDDPAVWRDLPFEERLLTFGRHFGLKEA